MKINKTVQSILGIGLIIILIFVFKGCYKESVKDELVQDLTTQTQNNEGEAIEKAKQINADIDQLSDADVDAGLLTYFRPETRSDNKQGERVPSLSSDPSRSIGHRKNQTPSTSTQQAVPKPMPRKLKHHGKIWNETIWQNTVNRTPCKTQYGFDQWDNIVEVQTCVDN